MAGPSLGTLLIQRLDAALGTTLSQQTQIVNRATSNPVPHPGQTVRPEPVSNTLVRDGRTNVERATLGTPTKGRVGLQPSTADSIAAGRSTGPAPTTSATTSATTSLGVAARIILELFAHHSSSSTPVTARAPLIGTAPQPLPAALPGTAPAPLPGTASAPLPGTASALSAAPGATLLATGQAAQSATVLGGAPDAPLSQALARALSQSLQQSGLFYESHLRGMLSGQYRLADIRQEPQAQIPAQTSQPASSTPGVDPSAQGIVRQQLEALADQSIHWRGEAWPGAVMDWQVRRHTEQQSDLTSQEATEDEPWQSQITLQLPHLGHITMDVRLAGKQVYVRLQANEDTATLLQQHASDLHGQMHDRQLELTSITFAPPEAETDTTPDTPQTIAEARNEIESYSALSPDDPSKGEPQ